ncbi:murein biosynthesis integral membrane protein MurJ [Oscillatoria sp. FACHB-1406]|uniref:murein biosynthesis integral membrane protein MurJ n=1 Tax=Oscillatoria sp. FACHB-1406 TaxID=2692846 RepID=UPI0016866740|nr:murein biosynthesis integral membrane protein MurJ [Oscillatoria sp. FACHB-1406]
MSADRTSSRSLAKIAGIVAVATLISKVFGLFREVAIAAAFGVGPVVNAYAYAYVIPGFLLILLGGINGPFHSALVSVLAKRKKEEAAPIVETVTTFVSIIFIAIVAVLIAFAGLFIDILAPGLEPTTRASAVQQLQIMAPLSILAGLIGIGFGTLNASDRYWLPSISPIFSSVVTLVGLGGLMLYLGDRIQAPQYITLGGIVLAGTTLAGGILQWLVQLVEQWRGGLGTLKLRFDWRTPGVSDVMKVMAPAALSSGMLHINVYTDLYFASAIEGAAAAMRYANFIVLTPLGIISNMLLVPLLPVFSRLTGIEHRSDLKLRIRQGLILTALSMLPLTAIFIALAVPIVRLIYERYAFDAKASAIVAPVLMAYGFGMFFYLGRDILVRVFYALGDGETPFRVSIINIFINAVLDYFLIEYFATPGLVMATVSVNFFSMVCLLWILHRRLGGLPLVEWGSIFAGLTLGSILASACSWAFNWGWEQAVGTDKPLFLVLDLGFASAIAFVVFFLVALQFKLPELELLRDRVRQKFSRR